MGRVQDKVAIVTGAGSGIGEGIAKRLAEEGALIIIADISSENGQSVVDTIASQGLQARYMSLDVTNLNSWRQMVSDVIEAYGKIDVLVNNAGITSSTMVLEEVDIEKDWHQVINVDLTGPFYGIYTCIPYMKKRQSGSIINIASVAGLVAQTGVNGYVAAKGGLISLTRSVAVDFAKDWIRCNAICPTTTQTPNYDKVIQEISGLEEMLLSQNVMQRVAQPTDIANGVLFLASDESSYVTGVTLPIDGGYTAR